MLKPPFGIEPPEWREPIEPQSELELEEQDEEGEGE